MCSYKDNNAVNQDRKQNWTANFGIFKERMTEICFGCADSSNLDLYLHGHPQQTEIGITGDFNLNGSGAGNMSVKAERTQ